MPQPGNPLAWDRYGYVLNNPVRYTDPSGHAFDAGDDGGATIESIIEWIEETYKWDIIGNNWSPTELNNLMVAGVMLRDYVSEIRMDDGIDWIRKYLGGTKIYHWIFTSSMGPDSHTVYLARNFEKFDWQGGVEGMLIHEFAHVLDNRFGLYSTGANIYPVTVKGGLGFVGVPLPAVITGEGPADALYTFLGGEPGLLRFSGGVNLPQMHMFPDTYNYGNNSSADYFAHTFSISIVDVSYVPVYANSWLRAFVSCMP